MHAELVVGYRLELQALARQQVHRLAQSRGNGNLASFRESSFVHGITVSFRFIMSNMIKRHDIAEIVDAWIASALISRFLIKHNLQPWTDGRRVAARCEQGPAVRPVWSDA
jgi:hypothetical protein